MAGPPTIPNPLVEEWADYVGLVIRITVFWNATTRAITSATVHRDAGCQYSKILIGLGPDGTPDTTTRVFDVSNFSGDRNLNANQVSNAGFNVIDDFKTGQITAGR